MEKLPKLICAVISFAVLYFTVFSNEDWTQLSTWIGYVFTSALGTSFLKWIWHWIFDDDDDESPDPT